MEVFNFPKLIEEQKLKLIGMEYTIGVSSNAYCLARKIGDDVEVLLSKAMINQKEFEEEVSNLAKYFNAVIVGDNSKAIITDIRRGKDTKYGKTNFLHDKDSLSCIECKYRDTSSGSEQCMFCMENNHNEEYFIKE